MIVVLSDKKKGRQDKMNYYKNLMNKKILFSVLALGLLFTLGMNSALAQGWFHNRENFDPEKIVARQTEMFENHANLLGINVNEMKEYWAAGKNLKEIATELNISDEDLRLKMQESRQERMQESLNTLVENGVITQRQADSRLTFMQDRMNNFDGQMGKFGKRGLKEGLSEGCRFNKLNK